MMIAIPWSGSPRLFLTMSADLTVLKHTLYSSWYIDNNFTFITTCLKWWWNIRALELWCHLIANRYVLLILEKISFNSILFNILMWWWLTIDFLWKLDLCKHVGPMELHRPFNCLLWYQNGVLLNQFSPLYCVFLVFKCADYLVTH